MRTVELSDEVFEQASRAAAARGLTVVEYLGRRIVEDVPVEEPPKAAGKRVRFPIFESRSPGGPKITRDMVDQAEREDDMERSGMLG